MNIIKLYGISGTLLILGFIAGLLAAQYALEHDATVTACCCKQVNTYEYQIRCELDGYYIYCNDRYVGHAGFTDTGIDAVIQKDNKSPRMGAFVIIKTLLCIR